MSQSFDLAIVVDDDPDILLAARLALRGSFAEVLCYTDPEHAFAAIRARSPDVILFDDSFAVGAADGAESWLERVLDHDPEAVVVLTTTRPQIGIALDIIKRGATDFVAKPWSNDRLQATVATAARLRIARRATAVEKTRVAALNQPADRRSAAAR